MSTAIPTSSGSPSTSGRRDRGGPASPPRSQQRPKKKTKVREESDLIAAQGSTNRTGDWQLDICVQGSDNILDRQEVRSNAIIQKSSVLKKYYQRDKKAEIAVCQTKISLLHRDTVGAFPSFLEYLQLDDEDFDTDYFGCFSVDNAVLLAYLGHEFGVESLSENVIEFCYNHKSFISNKKRSKSKLALLDTPRKFYNHYKLFKGNPKFQLHWIEEIVADEILDFLGSCNEPEFALFCETKLMSFADYDLLSVAAERLAKTTCALNRDRLLVLEAQAERTVRCMPSQNHLKKAWKQRLKAVELEMKKVREDSKRKKGACYQRFAKCVEYYARHQACGSAAISKIINAVMVPDAGLDTQSAIYLLQLEKDFVSKNPKEQGDCQLTDLQQRFLRVVFHASCVDFHGQYYGLLKDISKSLADRYQEQLEVETDSENGQGSNASMLNEQDSSTADHQDSTMAEQDSDSS